MIIQSPFRLFHWLGFIALCLFSNGLIGQDKLQEITCGGINYVINSNQTVTTPTALNNVNLLRCENDVLLAELTDGNFKLLNSSNAWIDIKQLITIGANSYYIKKSDGSVYNAGTHSKLGNLNGVDYLISNDKQLVAVKGTDYHRWDGSTWAQFTPTFVPEELKMTDEGLWFFIQNRGAYDLKGDIFRRDGLTLNASGQAVMEFIPLRGKCDKFLWRVNNISGN